MNKETIKQLALSNGFKLKEQPDGALELNPYVYEFAEKLLEQKQTEINNMKDAMLEINRYWNRDCNEQAMTDYCWFTVNRTSDFLE